MIEFERMEEEMAVLEGLRIAESWGELHTIHEGRKLLDLLRRKYQKRKRNQSQRRISNAKERTSKPTSMKPTSEESCIVSDGSKGGQPPAATEGFPK
jgi:hypothetical protein